MTAPDQVPDNPARQPTSPACLVDYLRKLFGDTERATGRWPQRTRSEIMEW
jgi:hypothetical protein